MALQTREGAGKRDAIFLNINAKEGCFQTGSKNKGDLVKHPAGDTTATGTVVAMKVEESSPEAGVINHSLRLKLRDTDPEGANMFVTFTIQTGGAGTTAFGLRALSTLLAADLTKPVSLTPWHMPAGTQGRDGFVNDSDMTGITFHQEGVKLKSSVELPKLPVVKVGSKEVTDKTVWDNMLNDMLSQLSDRVTVSPSEGTPAEAEDGIDPGQAMQEASSNGQQFRHRA
jgi:hypothetical protein